ncbi:Zinc finger BED domain-containing protein RICESLEEPER 3 [Rhynchospora pubera]|uniref:Zinc finger BED domain-containing protein RICESLEEPER 3 n=1 Tax=Rhynchospora pubera TaxID=906938 RepID=A0AAV8GU15_9POAL|nr:Zinc finger BED domain-containing protein RICESLEEPER 3 [Rhynchospora pubera]
MSFLYELLSIHDPRRLEVIYFSSSLGEITESLSISLILSSRQYILLSSRRDFASTCLQRKEKNSHLGEKSHATPLITMSNVGQFEDSNSRSKKGEEKVQHRPSNKRSKVWDEFVEIEQPDGSKKAKCSHCGNELCCDTKKHGTSQLRRHLNKGCPKKVAKIALSDSREYHKNHELCEYHENQLGYDLHNDQEVPRHRDLAYNQQRNRELFVKMVIDSKTMLGHVENPFLKEFALTLQPLYSPLDRRTVEKDCLTFYENEKAKLKDELSKLTSRVSFSLIYSCRGKYCVAAHFIDNNFNLGKRVVGFTGGYLESIDAIKDFLNDWTFGKSVPAIMCDTRYSPIEKYRLEWNETLSGTKYIFVGCILCHLKEIAAIFFSEIFTVYYHIHGMLEKLMQSNEQMSSFNKIVEEQSLPPKTEFILYDKRGLGSKFNIFHDAYTYKRVLLELDNSTDIEWNIVEEVVGILNPINDIVGILSSTECPTINLLVKLVLQVKDGMSNASPSPILSSTKIAVNESVTKLEKYLASCDEIVHFAFLLDPQLKLRFLEYCNGQGILDGKEVLEQFCNFENESIEISNNPKYFEHEPPELQKYWVSNSVDQTDDKFDVLGWWKSNELEYPILSRMARDILAIPITCSLTSGTEPLEGIFDEIYSSNEMSEVLVCCNNWLRSNCNYGNFQARTSEENGQIKMTARREKGNDLWAIVKSENANPKHHLDKARCSNYEGVRVAQGNNFRIAPQKCRELLTNMVITSKTSFTLLKSSSFIEWARDLQPMYDPNIVSVERDLVGFYQIDRGMLSSFLDKNLSRISLSVHRLGYNKYVNVTAHYIDSDFNLVTIIIGMKDMCNLTDDDMVKAQLERYIQSRGLNEKVLALTIGASGIERLSQLNYSVGESLQCSTIALFYELFYIIMNYFHIKYGCMEEMIELVGKNSNVMQIFNQPASELHGDVLPYKDVFGPLTWKNVDTVPCERWKCCVQLFKLICKAAIVLSSFKYPTSHLFLRIFF